MPIQLNQLNTSPLAALASQTVPNLNLKTYSIDAGAIMSGIAAGIMKKADLQELYSRQQNLLTIEKLQQKGQLSIAAANNAAAKERTSMEILQRKLTADADRAVQQQQVNQQGDYYKGQLGLGQAELAHSDLFKQAELGLRGQELDNTKAYQMGQLALGNRGLDLQQKNAEAEQHLNMIKNMAAMKEEQRKTYGSYASIAYMASQIPDAKQRQEAIQGILDSGVKSGDIPQELATNFMKLSPLQQQLKAAQLMSIAGMAGEANSKVSSAGMQFVTDPKTGLTNLVPKQEATNFDKELDKTNASIYKETSDNTDTLHTFLQSVNVARNDLSKVSEYQLGPVKGALAKLTNPQVQSLESSLNSLALQAKEIYKLGSGQGFTDADRDFLVQITGGIGNYKGTLEQLMNKSESLAQHGLVANWLKQNDIMKKSSTYQDWLSSNPVPEVKVKNKEGVIGTIPASQLKEAISSGEYEQIQ